ncbi:MAG: DUF11 domain-containing protein, partial [Planctomycetaceae bacterium]|nr:DUF11 domain-containing protein [Planctomycetaceae bacterium]
CWVCLGFLTVGLASCANINEKPMGDPFLARGAAPEQDGALTTMPENETPSQEGTAKSIAGIPLPVNSGEGQVVANHMEIRQVSNRLKEDSPPAQNQLPTPEPGTSEWCQTVESLVPGQCPPVQYPQGMCPPCDSMNGLGMLPGASAGFTACPPVVPGWIGGNAIPPIPKHYPDEYLCDGGDRGYPVRYDFNMRLGLETEDTVAEYTDHTGDSHLKPTNKVCVYSPRFGAMRTVGTPVLDTKVDQLASADKFQRGAGMRNLDATGIHKQNLALSNYRMRERASNIEVDLRSAGVDQAQGLLIHTKLINTFEDLQFVRSGTLVQTDEVRLLEGLQAAASWTRTQFPVVAAQTDQAQEVTGEFHAQEIVGKEDKRKPGQLRIVKLADKKVAQPGDVVTFTIRYDNIGERELYEIRIIDNLTPRLQYVENSETSDRAGELLLQDNQEGSLILEFHLDEPLPAGQGGVVTFQAKVR